MTQKSNPIHELAKQIAKQAVNNHLSHISQQNQQDKPKRSNQAIQKRAVNS
jgi:hypothetical protein